MKTLEELGISPTPWKYIGYHYHKNGEYIHLGEVWVKGGKHKIVVDISQPDARMMTAAPKLYDKAYEVAENLLVHLAVPGQTISMNRAEVDAMVKDLQSALAEAAGESEVKR